MKPAPIDYDTVREMLRTATPDRVLRFIGKSHPADIALLFKGLDSAEVRQLFDVLFSSRRAAKTLRHRRTRRPKSCDSENRNRRHRGTAR